MPTDSLRNTRKKRACFAKVSEVEKQLWERIHSHGVLDTGVKGLYHKACCIYETLFLSDNELQELQNIEYLLWRLHYKHIDEFRKTLCQIEDQVENNLAKDDSRMNNVNVHMEGLRLFLSKAKKFYQDLIRNIKRYNDLFDEPWFYKNDGISGCIEQKKLNKCQFVCHRLCICLGDLARYVELYEKPSNDQRNWAIAASYYLEAAKIYPDGGNPQNQLAVLATYIGKDFLALYHCIRSLAVKEPFPDALQNLMLLFERNRSSNSVTLTGEVFDFHKPSVWTSAYCEERTNENSMGSKTLKVAECVPCGATDFWTLFIRMTSFFFLECSLESFTSTFASTLNEFEALLALDVGELSSALQSYKSMNLLKAGPYRALHVVSVLLFIIHNLTVYPEQKIWNPTKDGQKSELVSLALAVTFTFMGRLVDRCLKGTPVMYFPLLPALLVFLEWLAGAIIKLDALDEKCDKAMSYFFDSFVKLLNHLQENSGQIGSSCNVALWEDYELRGFTPLSPTHELLDFSSHWDDEINYKMKNEYRGHRIIQASIKIARRDRDNTSNLLCYDKVSKMFTIDSGEPKPVEEEEDIVFKPLECRSSEPITLKDGEIPETSDESLRRASSLLVAQNRALIDSFSSQNEYIMKGSKSNSVAEIVITAGPPSLSSWVRSGDTTKNDCIERTVLKSVAEITPKDFRSSSLTENDGSGCSANHYNPDFCSSQIPDFMTGNFPRVGNHAPQAQYYAPRNLNSIFGSGASGFGLVDHWSHNDPLVSLPTMFCEGSPPLFNPSPSLLHGLHDQKRDIKVSDATPKPEPELLLQYLKQRECQLQQKAQFTGSFTQK